MNGKHVIFVSVANMQSDGFHHCVCLRVSSSVSLLYDVAKHGVPLPYRNVAAVRCYRPR